ncbi:amino acid adenylation domain-containing protein [Streptomyces sp. NPDC051940]|uniref:non-ribosomal peptide synthetase n=1 Tax=Streptomyces sp. NPDC051940 TaxID=3155675 RepID=UPI00343F71B0
MPDLNETEAYPLSPVQERTLALAGPVPQLCQLTVRLPEGVGAAAVEERLAGLVERYEILRTSIAVVRGMRGKYQVIAPHASCEVRESPGNRETAAVTERERCALSLRLEVAVADGHLLVTAPALLADLESLVVMASVLRGEAGAIGDLQYADYSQWRRDLLETAADAPADDILATLRPESLDTGRFAVPGTDAAPRRTEEVHIAEAVLPDHADPEAVLLTAWTAVLSRVAGNSVTMAVGVDGRAHPEVHAAIGAFSRYLPMTDTVDTASCFTPATAAVRNALNGLRDNQDTLHFPTHRWPFGFSYRELPAWADDARCDGEPFVLRLECDRRPSGGIRVSVRFDAARVHPELARSLGEQTLQMLPAAEAEPGIPIGLLPIVPPADGLRTGEFNDTVVPVPDRTVLDLVAEQAALRPDATAVIGADVQLSYAELLAAADALAGRLADAGVTPGRIVGVCVPRSPALLVAILGVLRAGAAYLPLDARYPASRLQDMVDDAGTTLVVTADGAPVDGLEGPAFLAVDGPGAACGAPAPVSGDDLAYVLFTSGSTGRPKGVMVTHAGLTNYCTFAARRYGAGDGTGAPMDSPISFDLTVTSLFPPLIAGRPVTLLPDQVGLERIEPLADSLRGGSAFSLVKLTPSSLASITQIAPAGELAAGTRTFVIGGEQLTFDRVQEWRRDAPGVHLINEYGPTETVVGCCIYEVNPDDPGQGPVPIGRPIANTRLYVLDARLNPLPLGHIGELYVAGTGVARGYVSAPGRTAERFLPDPGTAGERMYRTGDLARMLPTGELEFLGRADHQVKVRGFRIEPGEIDAVLTTHAAVIDSATIAREDIPGDERLVSYVTLSGPLPVDTLLEHARGLLPAHMVPSVIVPVDAIPVTVNGKVDHAALPAPGTARQDLSTAYVEPRTDAERYVTELFADVLKLDRVGAGDDFFTLGGHSLLVTQVTARIREALGIRVPLRQLFATPTVEAFAPCVADALAARLRELDEADLRPDLAEEVTG